MYQNNAFICAINSLYVYYSRNDNIFNYKCKYNKKCKCYNITKKGYQYLISKMTKFNHNLSQWKLIKILEKKENLCKHLKKNLMELL